jgi:hypothetical protein
MFSYGLDKLSYEGMSIYEVCCIAVVVYPNFHKKKSREFCVYSVACFSLVATKEQQIKYKTSPIYAVLVVTMELLKIFLANQ